MGEIEFDFGLAYQQKLRLEEMVIQMDQTVLSEFESTVQMLLQGWEGDAAHKFRNLAGMEAERLKRTEELLEEAASSLQGAIQTAKLTEEKAKEIAIKRTY